MLTGRYAWRQKGTGVLPGDAALIIDPQKPTLQSALRQAGYRTGVVGKWHLGLGPEKGVDWNQPIVPGANETGFDRSFIMAATGDRVPCVYVADGQVVGLDPADPIEVSYKTPFPGLPTGTANRSELKMDWSHGHNMAVVNGVGRIGFMKGGKKALWNDETMSEEFAREAVKFLNESKEKPFFLYFALHNIHVPRIPNPRFIGKTTMGVRGDSIVEADWQVGEILRALDELKLTENTLVIFTSDNGPVVDDGYKDDAKEKLGDHKPAGPFRGGKYSIFEGGTRMAMAARWPARIKAGKVTDAMISQIDFPRTFAHIAGKDAPAEAFPDSMELAAALTGEAEKGRDTIIEHSGRLAIRSGNWKLIPQSKGPKMSEFTGTELGNLPTAQLYDLAKDPGETQNVAAEHADIVEKLAAQLASIRDTKE
jgi:arylsulfatase A-like enzyme